jgi:hypothetical protein
MAVKVLDVHVLETVADDVSSVVRKLGWPWMAVKQCMLKIVLIENM